MSGKLKVDSATGERIDEIDDEENVGNATDPLSTSPAPPESGAATRNTGTGSTEGAVQSNTELEGTEGEVPGGTEGEVPGGTEGKVPGSTAKNVSVNTNTPPSAEESINTKSTIKTPADTINTDPDNSHNPTKTNTDNGMVSNPTGQSIATGGSDPEGDPTNNGDPTGGGHSTGNGDPTGDTEGPMASDPPLTDNEYFSASEQDQETTINENKDNEPIDNRHDNDQEMASQSSGDTEPVDDNDEQATVPANTGGTLPANSGGTLPANSGGTGGTGSGSKDKEKQWSDASSGSEDDNYWCRPWRNNWSQPRKITLPKLSRYSSYDTQQYREGYQGKQDNERIDENFLFYTNEIPSYPEGDFVDTIHKEWWGNYSKLEYHHAYIQWLFPIRERGLNWHAKELQLHEKKKIVADKQAHKRVLVSYKMMLDFYGLELTDEAKGDVKRSPYWKERFDNLNHSSHNYLRITRILKCLGEFEYEHLKAPLIKHFLREAICERELLNTLNSCVNYWIEVVKDDKEREELHQYARELVKEANSKLS